ncbi:hypothetical protein MBLNU230_g8070t1 [Neophaeotheca triangularis]
MSSLYNLEPQPTAKVVLSTTEGDIELSLFAKQIPLASRNFLQHCLDGYYTNTLFHRVVPGFIVQGGDPSGTGSGGEAAINNGEGFERELHSRIKFNRRGLLGIPAVDDGKEVHGSQFFFTLAQTPELEGKCTMLGRVEGDTLYNLMKIGEGVVEDGTDRPMYPAKITGCDVVVNPFEDMVARVKEAPRTKAEKEDTSKGTKKRKKPKGMLSFADEGDQDVQPVKKKKANPNFVDAGPEMPEEMNNTKIPEAPAPKVRPQKMRSPSPARRAPMARPVEASQPQSDSDDEMLDQGPPAVKKSKLDTTNEEIAALKASMKRTIDTGSKEAEKPKSALEAMIPSTTTKGRSKRGKPGDEPGAFDAFQAFKSRLESLPAKNTSKAGAQADAPTTTTTEAPKLGPDDLEETDVCDLHFVANCQSCKAWDEEEEDEDDNDDPTWMVSGLHFPKDTLGKDLEWKKAMADVEVVDTKNSGGK